MGRRLPEPAGVSLVGTGYRVLTQQQGHDLVTSGGIVMEHRSILYDQIGPGPHPCHWIDVYECGHSALHWGGLGGNGLVVDHLDEDRSNNDPANLVVSCYACNVRRGRRNELTAAKVREIRRLAKTGLTHRVIGQKYGITKNSVWRIVHRYTWDNVDG